MSKKRVPATPRTPGLDPESPASWRAFLDARVEEGVLEYSEASRGLLEHLQASCAASADDGRVALACGLLAARRQKLRGRAARDFVLGRRGVVSLALVHDGTVTEAEWRRARGLAASHVRLRKLARTLRLGILVGPPGPQALPAEALKALPAPLADASSFARSRVAGRPELFRALAFADPGERPSRVALALTLLRALAERVIPLEPLRRPATGRHPAKGNRLAAAFLGSLPSPNFRPVEEVQRRCGPLGTRAAARCVRAATAGIGLEEIPGRYELLVRLLAAAGDPEALSLLADSRYRARRTYMIRMTKRVERYLRSLPEDEVLLADDLFAAWRAGVSPRVPSTMADHDRWVPGGDVGR